MDWTATALVDLDPRASPAETQSANTGTSPPDTGAEVSAHESAPAEAPHIPPPAPEPRKETVQTNAEAGKPSLSAIERLSVSSTLTPSPRPRKRLLTVAWAASFAILAGLGAASYVKREQLMRQWPASIRVYAMIGLAPADVKAEPAGGTAEKPAH